MTAFILGASITAPKEVWILDFRDIVRLNDDAEARREKENEDPRENNDSSPKAMSPEKQKALVRSTMREIMLSLSNSIDRNIVGWFLDEGLPNISLSHSHLYYFARLALSTDTHSHFTLRTANTRSFPRVDQLVSPFSHHPTTNF